MTELLNQIDYLTNITNDIYDNIQSIEKLMFTRIVKNKNDIILFDYLTNMSKCIDFEFINYENVIFTNGVLIWYFDNKLYKLENNSSILIQEFNSNIRILHKYIFGYRILTDNNELWDNDVLIENNIKIKCFCDIFVIDEDDKYYEITEQSLMKSNKSQELINFLVHTDNN